MALAGPIPHRDRHQDALDEEDHRRTRADKGPDEQAGGNRHARQEPGSHARHPEHRRQEQDTDHHITTGSAPRGRLPSQPTELAPKGGAAREERTRTDHAGQETRQGQCP